ncbi:unnamed protein product [Mytilus coruscus]|uniref:Apple domain-containing protein n=1 Tax=Mytilus coruscus TaxID=42192 RepID=A0A6J8AZR3_MYTCO|nr:unnamed protein product [Mytilus coruscus]
MFANYISAYRCFANVHRNKIGDCPSYRTDNKNLVNCKDECIEDENCRAASFNKDTNECSLHICPTSNDTSLASQSHIIKTCGYSICRYNYAGTGYGYCSSRTYNAKDLKTCLKFCEASYDTQDFNCTAVAYPSIIDFQNCALFDCTSYNPLIITSNFYIRHCPEEREETCPWTEDTSGIRGACLPYDKIFGTLSQCQASCDEEVWCLGLSFRSGRNYLEIGPCFRYPCNISTGGRVGNIAFYSRKCSGIITSTSLMQRDEITSTVSMTTIPYDEDTTIVHARSSFFYTNKNTVGEQFSDGTESSSTFTGKVISNPTGSSVAISTDDISSTLGTTTAQVEMNTLFIEDATHSNGMTYNPVTSNSSRTTTNICLCWCKNHENETFDDFYGRIVKPLKVNKKSLSSTIRKLTCANDNRPSAARVGYVGVITLLLVMFTIVALDFSSLANQVVRRLRQYKFA